MANMQIKTLLFLLFLGVSLIMPVEVFHGGVWLVVHAYHLLEFILDEFISHFFQTSRRTTQIIVFYLMVSLILFGLYRLFRKLRWTYSQLKIELANWRPLRKIREISGLHYFPINKKITFISGFTFGAFVLLFW